MKRNRKRKPMSIESMITISHVMKWFNIVLDEMPCNHPIGRTEQIKDKIYCLECGVDVSARKIFQEE